MKYEVCPFKSFAEKFKNCYYDPLKKEYRYFGPLKEINYNGETQYCFGFWFFHIYYDMENKEIKT